MVSSCKHNADILLLAADLIWHTCYQGWLFRHPDTEQHKYSLGVIFHSLPTPEGNIFLCSC